MAARLFIVHAPEDEDFVGHLVHALALPEEELQLSSNYELGALTLEEIERHAHSPVTLAVISPAMMASPLLRFTEQLAQHLSVEGGEAARTRLVPLVLEDCELPARLRALEKLDFRNRDLAHWERSVERLRRTLDPGQGAELVEDRPPPCPYPGMTPFGEQHADAFYGRQPEIDELLERLRMGRREIYVIGPSGSGKSSLVMAGLVPAMKRTPALAGGELVVVPMRPNVAPLETLAAVLGASLSSAGAPLYEAINRKLAEASPAHKLLLFVDQLEELFAIAAAAERQAFIEAIRQLRTYPRVVLIFTLRADFYGALMESALWDDLEGRLDRLDVGPLRGPRLLEAIAQPAMARGVRFERLLLERLRQDVADEPGTLPLLQDTLVVLWHRQSHRLLRLEEYEAMSDGRRSGLAVTVARRADSALHGLSPPQLALARRIFLRLIQFGDGAADTRRQLRRHALAMAGDPPAEIDAMIARLTDCHLLTLSGGPGGDGGDGEVRIDLAHEILLTAWPQLQAWIGKHREQERRRREYEGYATRWAARRGAAGLFDESELAEIDGWLHNEGVRELGLSRTLVEMIEASRNAGTRREREQAARRAEQARSYVEIAQKELADERGARAAPYLLAAREAGIEERSLRALFQWSRQFLPLTLCRPAGGGKVVVSPDGTQLATAGSKGVQLWHLDGRPTGTPPLAHPGWVTDAAWSPAGELLATVGADKLVRLWNARTGEAIGQPLRHAGPVSVIAWSPDGLHLATAGLPHHVRIWEVSGGSSGEMSGEMAVEISEHHGAVLALAWSPNGVKLATASQDGTARVWLASSGKPATTWLEHAGPVRALAWSLDGKLLATGSQDATAQVWDAQSGKKLSQPLRHQGAVLAVAWQPRGADEDARLATASEDKTARVWDVRTSQAVLPPLAHDGDVIAVAWSADGSRVATASEDKTARIWDGHSGAAVSPWLEHQREVVALAWSGDGARVITTSEDQRVRSWDAHAGEAGAVTLAHRAQVRHAAWSPDGRHLATACDDQHARIWSVEASAPLRPRLLRELRHGGWIKAVAWSPDGTMVATAGSDGVARIWEAQRGEAAAPPLRHSDRVVAVAWSPDGTMVATASDDHTARIWSARDGALVGQPLEHQGAVTAIAWSGGGARLATASEDYTARIWDAGSGRAVTASLRHQGQVRALAWSPDGTKLATGGDDKMVRLWSAHSGALLATFGDHKREIAALAWSPDGAMLATASFDKTARVWSCSAAPVLLHALQHRAEVTALAWSPDGARLATASFDQSARVWDPRAGYEIGPAMKHQDWVWSVAWSPEGTRLVSTSEDRTAQVWEAPWREQEVQVWREAAARGPYQLSSGGALIAREHELLEGNEAAPPPAAGWSALGGELARPEAVSITATIAESGAARPTGEGSAGSGASVAPPRKRSGRPGGTRRKRTAPPSTPSTPSSSAPSSSSARAAERRKRRSGGRRPSAPR